jgi:hypothetical protein
MRRFAATAVTALAAAAPAAAQPGGFDWALLEGRWSEGADARFACGADKLQRRMTPSEDRRTLVFENDRPQKLAGGAEVLRYTAAILEAQPFALRIRYGAELGLPEAQREWELRFVAPGLYRWRAAAAPEGRFVAVFGVRCEK